MNLSVPAYLHYDINLYAAVFIIAILMTMHIRRNVTGYGTRLFRRIVTGTLLMLVFEVLSWHFDSRPEPYARTLNFAMNWVYLWLNPLLACLWVAYIDYRIFESEQRLRRRLYYMYAMMASTLIMAVNLLRPLVFSVSSDNVYSREWGLWLLYAVSLATLAGVIVTAVRERRRIRHNVIGLLLLLVTIPAIGAGIQAVVYGPMIIWPLMTLVVVLAYIMLENHNASIDYLTGVFNRLRAEEHIRRMVDNRTPFALIIFDLDDFKLINDQFGHQEGDRALIRFTGVLTRTFPASSLVARVGGDEFIVAVRRAGEEDVRDYVDRVRSALESIPGGEMLQTSVGYTMYNPSADTGADELLSIVDARMYEDKSIRKNLKRRRTDQELHRQTMPGP